MKTENKPENEVKYPLFKLSGTFVLAGLASASLIYGMSAFKDRQAEKESYLAHKQYERLEQFADIDKDGSLSEVEKKLMFERLDNNQLPANLPWRFAQNNNRWDYADLRRIEKAINLYENE